jgi:hypothetical protein
MDLVLEQPDNESFHWNYSGQEHELSDIPELLTRGLLESDYNAYLFLLNKAYWNGINISRTLNDTNSYNSWFSTHTQCLSFLVGTRVRPIDTDRAPYYGKNHEGIPDEVGVTILYKMIELGADLTIQNYYGEDIRQILQGGGSSPPRENNTNFKSAVLKTYPQNLPSNGKIPRVDHPPLK